VNQFGGAGESDGAAYRAACAARALATVAYDAAREYVERDGVAAQANGTDVDMVERARQARLRRWHEPPHPNRKDR
jgi:hypothetical protein